MKYLVPLVLAMLLGACTPMQWVKPDATPDQINADAIRCQQDAWREARVRNWFYQPYSPMVVRDAAGRAFVISPGPFYDPFYDPFMEEARLTQFCMRSKGYSLEPADKPQPPSGYIQRDDAPQAERIQPSPSGTPGGKP